MEIQSFQSLGDRIYQEDFSSDLLLDDGVLAGVYDGHGGDKIARYCSNFLLPRVREKLQQQNAPERALVEAFVEIDTELKPEVQEEEGDGDDEVNSELKSEHQEDDEDEDDDVAEGPGSTAIVAVVQPGMKRLLVASVGDCRAVLSKKGNAVDLGSCHEPHLEQEWSRIQAAGGKLLPNGRLPTLDMSRSIGDYEYKKNRSLPVEQQIVIPVPEVVFVELEGDEEFLMLTSDGIKTESQKLVYFVGCRIRKGEALSEICREVVEAEEALSVDDQGETTCQNDNLTCLIIKLI